MFVNSRPVYEKRKKKTTFESDYEMKLVNQNET